MGRPREFCAEDALEKALHVFWRHGFEGASLSDLTAAMGITRPSLYACYGNKEDLFRRALDLYERRHLGFMRDALREPTARDVAARLLAGWVAVATNVDHPLGCMSTNGALACSVAADSIRAETARRRAVFEGELRGRFERADAANDLPPGTDPAGLASYLMTVATGIAVQAVGGASRATLQHATMLALRVWPDPIDATFPLQKNTERYGTGNQS